MRQSKMKQSGTQKTKKKSMKIQLNKEKQQINSHTLLPLGEQTKHCFKTRYKLLPRRTNSQDRPAPLHYVTYFLQLHPVYMQAEMLNLHPSR